MHLFCLNFRLRDGMSLNFGNWGNCTMFVEDLNAIGKNIAVEIPKDHAVHFKEMCKLFAFINSHDHDQAVDEYLLNLTLVGSANATNASAATNTAKSQLPLVESQGECSSQNVQRSDPRIHRNLPRLPSPIDSRQSFELDIFTIVVQFIHDLDPEMNLFPFGSTQYGVTHLNANYNLLVTTGETL